MVDDMRTAQADELIRAAREDLLTTGEAAALLGTSRQHVVDLCNAGDLAFVTTGTHRRVSRRDVEALRTRTSRLTRDQLMSLWLSHAVAGRLVQDPERTLIAARRNLSRMLAGSVRGSAKVWLQQWAQLLDGPILEILGVLTSRSPRSRELRQNSPFAGVLTEEEREAAMRAFRSADRKDIAG